MSKTLRDYLYHEEPAGVIYCGSSLDILRLMPPESVDCIMTSPPYWGLRKYDVPDIIWDGDKDCEHEWGSKTAIKKDRQHLKELGEILGCLGGNKHSKLSELEGATSGQFCLKCNAWRGQLGLEPIYQLYLSHLFQIFDECKRVLKKSGTCFVNLGDSYYGGKGQSSQAWSTENQERETLQKGQHQICGMNETRPLDAPQDGLQPKSLCCIPDRFKIGMVDRGWICRNQIIWWKRSCMPSSAKDRFTIDYESVFFFVKNQEYYFEQQFEYLRDPGRLEHRLLDPNNNQRKWTRNQQKTGCGINPKTAEASRLRILENGRNMRCVWDICPEPDTVEHYAAYPIKLCKRVIISGCPEEVCSKCGKPRYPIYETVPGTSRECPKTQAAHEARGGVGIAVGTVGKSGGGRIDGHCNLIGWGDCGCGEGFNAGIVLDPFAGKGTTAAAAKELNRQYIIIDL